MKDATYCEAHHLLKSIIFTKNESTKKSQIPVDSISIYIFCRYLYKHFLTFFR